MRLMCKSKIHRARVTKVDVHYEGSIGIDAALLRKADILPYEMVQVVNVNTGARFETYAIKERSGSGAVALYGGAARLGKIGDILILLSYTMVNEVAAKKIRPTVVRVDSRNAIKR